MLSSLISTNTVGLFEEASRLSVAGGFVVMGTGGRVEASVGVATGVLELLLVVVITLSNSLSTMQI